MELRYTTDLEIYNTKLSACEITLLLSSAVRTLCSLVSNNNLLEIFSFLSNNCRKTGNARIGIEIVNPCISMKNVTKCA